MSEKMQYLTLVQANIRRYGWQSFVVKILTVIVALVFIGVGMLQGFPAIATGGTLKLAFGVFLCMLLWLTDGHYSEMQSRYATLYKDAADSATETLKMRLEPAPQFNVRAIWNPMVLWYYVPIMGMMILIGLGAK